MNKSALAKIIFVEITLILFFSSTPWQEAIISNSAIIGNAQEIADKNELEIAFLDIGQGDATFINFPNQEQMLVDCGKDSNVLAALGRVMNPRDNKIDYLVITHPDADHYGGCVDVMDRFRVKNIIYNGLRKESDQFWQYFFSVIEELDSQGVNYLEIDQPLAFSVGGVGLSFIYPDHSIRESQFVPGLTKENDNNTSLVFSLKYGANNVLMTGDMEIELEKYLLAKYPSQLPADILKVGHHGSDTSSDKDFLSAVKPRYAVISSGRGNTFGHPSRRTLRKLERINAQTLRTDEKSDILFVITSSTLITN
ncbi:MAG: ComEC/Rec2 family competence protein [Patescibacteria group bacterium]